MTPNNGELGSNWGKEQQNATQQPTQTAEPVEQPQTRQFGSRHGGTFTQRTSGFDSRSERRKNGDETSYVNVGRNRRFGASAAQHTELLKEKFEPLIKADKERNPHNPMTLKVMLRDEFNIPYDAVIVGLQFHPQMHATPKMFYYPFIIAQSRESLQPLSYDNPYAQGAAAKFTLPNVCGDVPDDNIRTIDTIIERVAENTQSLFGTDGAIAVGARVIEASAEFEDSASVFTKLLDDAVETINTYIETSENVSEFDWSKLAVADSGKAVINDIDYRPEPLKSSTGIPIHRQLVLRTSGIEKSYDGSKAGGSTRTISEISAFIDHRYGQGQDPRDPQWLPVAVISDFNTESGGNIFHHILIGVANLVQLKDDMQFLSALDWRKKDEHNDISVMSCLAPEVFDVVKPAPMEISSTEEFFEIGKRAYVPSLEIAMDIGNTDRQSWLGPIFAGASVVDSQEYEAFVRAADDISGNRFSPIFFDDRNRDVTIVIDDDSFQLGATYRGADQELHDSREVGHLAVIKQCPNDPKKVQDYDYATIGGGELPAVALRTQLDIKTEICGKLNVNSYLRRYTFSPAFLMALYEACNGNLLIAPLDGAMRGPNDQRQYVADLFRRGVEARGASRSSRSRDEYVPRYSR